MKKPFNWAQKMPWGVLAGYCFILALFVTIGIIAAYLIIGAISGLTLVETTIFDSWWQTLLFVADVFLVFGFGASLTMFILKAQGRFEDYEDECEDYREIGLEEAVAEVPEN